jgi:hypothetical protein
MMFFVLIKYKHQSYSNFINYFFLLNLFYYYVLGPRPLEFESNGIPISLEEFSDGKYLTVLQRRYLHHIITNNIFQ